RKPSAALLGATQASSSHGSSEVFGGEADGHSAIAGRRSDHLGGSGADIADREHAGPAGLHEERLSPDAPPGLALADGCAEPGSREDEAILGELDLTREPLRSRLGPDQHDHRLGIERSLPAAAGLLDGDAREVPIAADRAYLVTEQDVDGGIARDPI